MPHESKAKTSEPQVLPRPAPDAGVIIEAGKFYIDGHGDANGPMEERTPGVWINQHGTIYHPDGTQWNYAPDSAGNLKRIAPPIPAGSGEDESICVDCGGPDHEGDCEPWRDAVNDAISLLTQAYTKNYEGVGERTDKIAANAIEHLRGLLKGADSGDAGGRGIDAILKIAQTELGGLAENPGADKPTFVVAPIEEDHRCLRNAFQAIKDAREALALPASSGQVDKDYDGEGPVQSSVAASRSASPSVSGRGQPSPASIPAPVVENSE